MLSWRTRTLNVQTPEAFYLSNSKLEHVKKSVWMQLFLHRVLILANQNFLKKFCSSCLHSWHEECHWNLLQIKYISLQKFWCFIKGFIRNHSQKQIVGLPLTVRGWPTNISWAKSRPDPQWVRCRVGWTTSLGFVCKYQSAEIRISARLLKLDSTRIKLLAKSREKETLTILLLLRILLQKQKTLWEIQRKWNIAWSLQQVSHL